MTWEIAYKVIRKKRYKALSMQYVNYGNTQRCSRRELCRERCLEAVVLFLGGSSRAGFPLNLPEWVQVSFFIKRSSKLYFIKRNQLGWLGAAPAKVTRANPCSPRALVSTSIERAG